MRVLAMHIDEKTKYLLYLHTMNKLFYSFPELEVIYVDVEQGFSLSSVISGEDYGDGGTGSEMD